MQSKCKNATEIKIELCVRIKQLNVENSLALNDNLPYFLMLFMVDSFIAVLLVAFNGEFVKTIA